MQMIEAFGRWLLHFVETYGDPILSLIIALGIVLLRIMGIAPQEWVSNAIALVISLLAIALVRDRKAREYLADEIHRLADAVRVLSERQVVAGDFLSTRGKQPSWQSRLQGAKTVDILALSLASLAISHQPDIQDVVDSGGCFRIIVTNPGNADLQRSISARIDEAKSPEHHRKLVESVLGYLAGIAGRKPGAGQVEIRVTDWFPPFSFVGTDTGQLKGKITIEMYLTQSRLDFNPIFQLDAKNDRQWFELFRNQFEIYWHGAKPVVWDLSAS